MRIGHPNSYWRNSNSDFHVRCTAIIAKCVIIRRCCSQWQDGLQTLHTFSRKMASERDKKPIKGILKHTSSLDKPPRREVEWDEMNILATHHPPDKDYGHIKIDEPPTPYNKCSDAEDDETDEQEQGLSRRGSSGNVEKLDPEVLASRLAEGCKKSAHLPPEEESSEDENETEEERAKRKMFEMKRKLHYNEFAAVQLAKKLMSEEEDEEDTTSNNTQGAALLDTATCSSSKMDAGVVNDN
ncbi:protein phosphatase inhibitor 2-like isoform X2 [Pomacea canaliculata]|uniref:protein phosphatase inhibitor 2-like isoform X2 n=1 Tax=Pomacea canaliculata TaxID=400727 RepID=UPI000D733399|nr:protein phosphatase inhibitor 2-like isoform X2 [Pomacea canaliculata]